MVVRKRKTTKTGNFSQRTTTLGTKGRTDSFSSKLPDSPTRRTVSYKNGKMRTTYSTKMGGGWTKVSSKTTPLVSKPKTTRRRRGRYKKGSSFWFWVILIVIVILLFA
jgi:hypothetical protein